MGLSRSSWARLERRARRAHERDLLRSLQGLARQASPVVRIEAQHRSPPALRLVLAGRRVVLAGTSGSAATAVAETFADGAVLVDAGRYGRAWWVTLSDGEHRRHVLGWYLQMVPDDDDPWPLVEPSPQVRVAVPAA